jgi:hypothetical protein
MRTRATVAVVSGALALSAFAVPASQAADSHRDRPAAGHYGVPAQDGAASKQRALTGNVAAADPVISKVVVNGGKPIVVGTTGSKKVTVAITASDDSGVVNASTIIWIGTSIENDPNGYAFYQNEDFATCKAASATTSTCTLTVTVNAAELINTDARTWKVGAIAVGNDDSYVQNDAYTTTKLQRASKLTVNAAPEPVKKGATVTVTGKLSRANWDTGSYAGYSTQSVVLQFRKKTSTAYTNVKGVKTSTTGALKTTTKATVDGYYRWSFAGTATTPAINVAGDYVDVK